MGRELFMHDPSGELWHFGSLGSTISLRHLPQKMTPSANRTISISSIMELEFSI